MSNGVSAAVWCGAVWCGAVRCGVVCYTEIGLKKMDVMLRVVFIVKKMLKGLNVISVKTVPKF